MLDFFDPKTEPLPMAGVFGNMVLPSRLDVAACPEQDGSVNKTSYETPAGVYGHTVSGSHFESDDEAEEETVRESFLLELTQARGGHRTLNPEDTRPQC